MIDISHDNPIVLFVIGAVLIGIYFWMLSDDVSSRIRKSKYWFPVWFLAILILSAGAQLMMPLLSGLNINDDVAVPVLFCTVAAVVFIAAFIQIYRLRRALRNKDYSCTKQKS